MKLRKITLACTDIQKMINFYSSVFNSEFIEHQFPRFKMFSAKIEEINFLFCPNEIAGVEAKQNRHQFDYECEDIKSIMKIALENDGEIHSDLQENTDELFAAIFDPDGNTINFIQKK